ncbi:MAG: flagellar motor stator protein MotA [Alphaproteobacteria bacterium]
MKAFISIAIVIISIIVGIIGPGGHMYVLWQPYEFLIIIGASLGAFLFANRAETLKKVPKILKAVCSGTAYKRADYLDMLVLIYKIIQITKNEGMKAIESHIDNPSKSPIFTKHPKFLARKRAVKFLCDYLRMLTMGSDKPYQMDELMEEEISHYKSECYEVVTGFQNMADGLPALGIVAAVLGVIHTMSSVDQPPEVLGKLMAGALVGTFTGVLLAYGFVAPLGQAIKNIYNIEVNFLNCIRLVLAAYMHDYAPILAIEYARKTIDETYRPEFIEIENIFSELAT